MLASIFPKSNGYVLDSNVLSLFVKIERLDLLLQLTAVPLYVTPVIQSELETGLAYGVEYLANALHLIHTKRLQIIPLTEIDRQFMQALPNKLADGEAEAIALCRRMGLTLISHDRKALNYCTQEGIDSLRLTTLVDGLQNSGLLTETESQTMFS